MAPGLRTSCLPCRHLHIKCDNITPTCGSCKGGKFDCHWDTELRFRYEFLLNSGKGQATRVKKSQKRLQLPENFQFVDETKDIEILYGSGTASSDSGLPHINDSCMNSTSVARNDLSPRKSSQNSIFLNSPLGRHEFASFILQSPKDILRPASHAGIFGAKNSQAVSQHAPYSHLSDPECLIQSLHTAEEARLMRHFVDCLSSWFDLFDHNRHFANVAPLRALVNPTLQNAIYAASARHLSQTSEFDPLVADDIHQKCLRTLIPVLSNSAALMDEELFAAAVILRLFEELDGPRDILGGTERQNHLLGVQVLLDAQKYTEVDHGLGQAAFKVAVRQEISVAFLHQRPILANLVHYDVDLTSSPASDDTWGYRSSMFLAWALQFCYGNEEKNADRWCELMNHYDWWLRHRPRAFEPFYAQGTGDGFPLIYYLGDVHVLTANHFTLARIVLLLYHVSQRDAEAEQCVETIRKLVYELCGIALSNPKVAVAFLSACAGITVCMRRQILESQRPNIFVGDVDLDAEAAWLFDGCGTTATEGELGLVKWKGEEGKAVCHRINVIDFMSVLGSVYI